MESFNNLQYESLTKLIILVLLILFAVATIKAIAKGVKDGVTMATDLKRGVSAEEIMRRDKEKVEKQKEIEKQKMKSTWYRITHPLEYFNTALFSKIENVFGKGNKK